MNRKWLSYPWFQSQSTTSFVSPKKLTVALASLSPIAIIFDEFGRYMESLQRPHIRPGALQQLFESVQANDLVFCFVSFSMS